jgi:hypothetical protein
VPFFWGIIDQVQQTAQVSQISNNVNAYIDLLNNISHLAVGG